LAPLRDDLSDRSNIAVLGSGLLVREVIANAVVEGYRLFLLTHSS